MKDLFEHRCMKVLKEGLDAGAFPSAAVAVGERDTVFFTETMGVRHSQILHSFVDQNTLYDLASLTKLVSPTMIFFRLWEEGKLLLTDPLARFFTAEELQNAPSMRKDITLFHLLTHTSGITPHMPLWKGEHTPDDAIKNILASQPVCAPGEEVYYSCMGYILLGKVLERVTGKTLKELAETMVFQPLGMTNTGYLPSNHNVAATEYSQLRGDYICGEVHDENAHYLGGISANAGVFSNIQDMTRFAIMLACRGKIDGQKYLSPCVFDAAIKNYTPNKAEARGLGFQLKPPIPALSAMGDLMAEGSYGHTGFTGTSLYVDASSGRWAVLLTNAVHYGRDKTAFFRYRRLFHNAVMSDTF